MKPDRRTASTVIVLGLLATVAVGWFVFPSPVTALTGEDVLDKMSSEERTAYLTGNIGMASFLTFAEGKNERSECITDWYYKDGGVQQLVTALGRFKDRQAQPIIYALIERACGK